MPVRPRCFFVALVAAWVVAIFLPSAIVAAAGLSPLADGRNLASATFEVADEVAPAAKIGFALVFALLLYAARRRPRPPSQWADIPAGALAMLAIVALLPEPWSRGFGIGLAGTRFDPALLVIYLAGGALAGLTFHQSEKRCRGRDRPASP